MKSFADSSLILDLVEESPRGRRFETHIASANREWCVSPLVRMECRVKALSESKTSVLIRTEEIFALMTSFPLTDAVFDRAAHVRAQTGLKSLDALHVATALEHGCGELWTADARLARTVVPGLAIRLVS